MIKAYYGEDFRRAGRAAIDLVHDFYAGLEARRVSPAASWEEVRALFAGTIGEHGIGLEAAVEDCRERVLPHVMGIPHPRYAGLVNSSPLPGAVLGDLIVSALNNNAGARPQSVANAAVEEELTEAFARLFGLEEPVSGLVVPGGSFAILQGLLLARGLHFPDWKRRGPLSVDGAPRIYTSTATHFAVQRSAQFMGVGEEDVIALPTRGRGTLDVDALAARIGRDRSEGARPFAVVASAGTTGTGAIDPFVHIAELCQQESLWLHVDACYGGAAMLVEELRPRFAGIEQTDSISVDLHKWFYVPIAAGLCLTRHPERERESFDVAGASYIASGAWVDPFRRGVPTSRRATALAIWLSLRAHGWGAIRRGVEANIARTRELEAALTARGFRVLPGGELSVACARYEPAGLEGARLDTLQQQIAMRVDASGAAWFGTVVHEGLTWLRFNFMSLYTEAGHIEEIAAAVDEAARTFAAEEIER